MSRNILHALKKAVRIASIVMLVGCFILSIYISWHATAILDGDASSEMVLADILHKDGAIFSDHWYYSTELRFFYCTQFFNFFFHFFTDWHLVRFAGTVTLLVLYLASWGYLSRQLKAGTVGFCVGGSLLLLPFSVAYGRIVLYHSFYSCYIIGGFTIVALAMSMDKQTKLTARLIRAGLLVIVSAVCGVSGVRMMLTTIAPLLCAELCCVAKHKRAAKAAEQWLQGIKAIVPGIVAAAGWLIGYLVNSRVLALQYHFASYEGTKLIKLSDTALGSSVQGLLADFGYDAGHDLMSVQGILSILCVLACIGLIVLVVYAFCSRHEAYEREECMAGGMALFALGIILLCFLLTKSDVEAYYYVLPLLPQVVWLVPIPAVLLGHAVADGRLELNIRSLLCLFCAGVLCFNSLFVARFFHAPASWDLEYEGLYEKNAYYTTELKPVVAFLQEKGYTFGCGIFWYASVVTEMTNGEIRMLPVDLYGTKIKFYEWLADIDLLKTPDDTPTFLLISLLDFTPRQAMFSKDVAQGIAKASYMDDHFLVIEYADWASLKNTLGISGL